MFLLELYWKGLSHEGGVEVRGMEILGLFLHLMFLVVREGFLCFVYRDTKRYRELNKMRCRKWSQSCLPCLNSCPFYAHIHFLWHLPYSMYCLLNKEAKRWVWMPSFFYSFCCRHYCKMYKGELCITAGAYAGLVPVKPFYSQLWLMFNEL